MPERLQLLRAPLLLVTLDQTLEEATAVWLTLVLLRGVEHAEACLAAHVWVPHWSADVGTLLGRN